VLRVWELDCVTSESSEFSLLQTVSCVVEVNNFHVGIKLTERMEHWWNGKLAFFIYGNTVISLNKDYLAPRAVNSGWCSEDESCSLVYSPGKLLVLFCVQTLPDWKK
jgi:hypothetical protein